MSLAPGTRIGGYDVLALVGAGGMGEVYRGRDVKLQRDVALKILPPLFARDPERLARFEREARTLAALNHPNIAQVYGVVDLPAESGSRASGSAALVMEFVDGEDLAERIGRAGAIPLEEALPIALQIATALEAAHEQGIIHRDLKPANIKLRGDGQVKVLDFGLAKALAPAEAGLAPPLDNSPTITSPFQMSQLGVILGTAAYMAPEQAKGKPVDKRADIWAFGCVLYEMLSGRRPFVGEDVTDTLAAIVRADPDWGALPAETPPHLRTLLHRCLEKDRRERLPDIGAARLELKEASPRFSPGAAAPVAAQRTALLPWLLFALASAAAIALGVYAVMSSRRPADASVYRSIIMPPSPLSGAPALRLQISPDGRRLAFVAPDESGHVVLWTRSLDATTAQAIAGTNDASSPFWSPDSRWVGFTAEGKLKKVELTSGAVMSLCDASASPPGSWSRDDIVLFTFESSIARVPASGGKPVPVTQRGPAEQTHISPFFLPDGRHFLYTVSAAGAQQPGIFVASLDSKDVVRIIDGASNAYYANGYLVFLRDTTLMAQPFDAQKRVLEGKPIPLAEGIQSNPATGTGAFSVSQTGVLVYQAGLAAGTQLTWFDRAGNRLGTLGDPGGYRDLQLSPDGRTASVTVSQTGFRGDIWFFDVERKLRRRFTFDEGSSAGVWSPDGRYLAYAARRGPPGATRDLYRRASSGGSAEELLFDDDADKIPLGFSPDGQMLLYRTASSVSTGELWLLPMSGVRKPRPFNRGDTSYSAAAVSPDGKWLAHASTVSGRREVYVTSFPDGNGKWQISSDGGDNPVWRGDGRELFFMSNAKLIAVDVKPASTQFESGAERTLFSALTPAAALGTRSTYAVTPDGQRFLVNTWNSGTVITPINLVVNWPASIR